MIMCLFGNYAIYQDQEFELVEHSVPKEEAPGGTEYWLLTGNPGAVALGFEEVCPGRYAKKKVPPEELSFAFRKNTRATYKGFEFEADPIKDGQVDLFVPNTPEMWELFRGREIETSDRSLNIVKIPLAEVETFTQVWEPLKSWLDYVSSAQ